MNVAFRCVHCGQTNTIPEPRAGQEVRCRACGELQLTLRPPGSVPAPDRQPESDAYALTPEPGALAPVVATDTAGSMRKGDGAMAGRRSLSGFWRELVRASAGESSLLERESLGLIVLSAADLLVTYALLRRGPSFYESNPVAQWFFVRWNIAGMTLFKFSAMSLAIVIGEFVERQRPGWGRGLLVVSCLATAVVVWHGLKLLFRYGDSGVPLQ
jgi:hypothetical protein